jgi:hypothetical protein
MDKGKIDHCFILGGMILGDQTVQANHFHHGLLRRGFAKHASKPKVPAEGEDFVRTPRRAFCSSARYAATSVVRPSLAAEAGSHSAGGGALVTAKAGRGALVVVCDVSNLRPRGFNRPCILLQRSQNNASSSSPRTPAVVLEQEFILGDFMKAVQIALAVIAIAALAPKPSEARAYAHRHGHHGCPLDDDYMHSNALSANSYIYPAANWGPFFRCRMYYAPVYVVLALP